MKNTIRVAAQHFAAGEIFLREIKSHLNLNDDGQNDLKSLIDFACLIMFPYAHFSQNEIIRHLKRCKVEEALFRNHWEWKDRPQRVFDEAIWRFFTHDEKDVMPGTGKAALRFFNHHHNRNAEFNLHDALTQLYLALHLRFSFHPRFPTKHVNLWYDFSANTAELHFPARREVDESTPAVANEMWPQEYEEDFHYETTHLDFSAAYDIETTSSLTCEIPIDAFLDLMAAFEADGLLSWEYSDKWSQS